MFDPCIAVYSQRDQNIKMFSIQLKKKKKIEPNALQWQNAENQPKISAKHSHTRIIPILFSEKSLCLYLSASFNWTCNRDIDNNTTSAIHKNRKTSVAWLSSFASIVVDFDQPKVFSIVVNKWFGMT